MALLGFDEMPTRFWFSWELPLLIMVTAMKRPTTDNTLQNIRKATITTLLNKGFVRFSSVAAVAFGVSVGWGGLSHHHRRTGLGITLT
jgi:hypothetical protein